MEKQLSVLWLVFGCGILFLIPIRHGGWRSWITAALNLMFIFLLAGARNTALIAALVFGVFLLLRAVAIPSFRVSAAITAAVVTLSLFVVHKLHAVPGLSGKAAFEVHFLQFLLATVGFSYVALRIIDVLRAVFEDRHPAPGLLATINYLLPFHMLLAGPIQRYDDFAGQPAVPAPVTAAEALRAAERLANGAFKKFVLALIVQRLFLDDFRTHGWHLFLEVQFFYIWLYLDFSGLSDIAVGMGALLGLRTPENFDRPYLARNMINFWERWHISLSQFIRANLYIPVQLRLVRWTAGRYALWCAAGAFLVSFGLCGLWHGISWRYFAWGLINAGGLAVTNIYRHYLTRYLGAKGVRKYLANWPIQVCATIVTFEFVALSLAFLRESL